MKNILKSFKNILKNPQQPIIIKIRSMGETHQIKCQEGQNLMDATNKTINEKLNVYGLCDKQLACTTCSVDIMKLYQKLPEPKEEQLDILYSLPEYKDDCTRMACQICITQDLHGMVVNVPKKTVFNDK